jgi:hypothetical protein
MKWSLPEIRIRVYKIWKHKSVTSVLSAVRWDRNECCWNIVLESVLLFRYFIKKSLQSLFRKVRKICFRECVTELFATLWNVLNIGGRCSFITQMPHSVNCDYILIYDPSVFFRYRVTGQCIFLLEMSGREHNLGFYLLCMFRGWKLISCNIDIESWTPMNQAVRLLRIRTNAPSYPHLDLRELWLKAMVSLEWLALTWQNIFSCVARLVRPLQSTLQG